MFFTFSELKISSVKLKPIIPAMGGKTHANCGKNSVLSFLEIVMLFLLLNTSPTD